MGKDAIGEFVMMINTNAAAIRKAIDGQGVCVLPGLFGQNEIDAYCQEVQRLWDGQQERVPQNLRLGLRADGQGATVIDRMDPVEDISEVFFQLNRHGRILDIMESIYGEAALVMKEKLIFKRPGTQGFAVHRDEPYFCISGVPGEKVLSIAIALDPANRENGNIEFYPSLTHVPVAADKQEPRDLDRAALGSCKVFSPELKAGDAVIYNALVPHQSGANLGKTSRRTYTISYTPASYPDAREKYYRIRYRQQQQEREGRFTGPFFVK